ncbi:TfoX/Sxy family protein [uncultured Sphingomonas sp.]|uniref:TfoX/Sxy family protein n=1 Tax=uncultured Sphingomonas sp. TaxID=158754 RepID=UPI0035CAA839
MSYIVDQLWSAISVTAKPMFGDHGLYCDGKMVAMICDGGLFVKPTAGGRAIAGNIEEASPYPGAKPCPLIDANRWDDADWLVDLAQITVAELPPMPKQTTKTGRKKAP